MFFMKDLYFKNSSKYIECLNKTQKNVIVIYIKKSYSLYIRNSNDFLSKNYLCVLERM